MHVLLAAADASTREILHDALVGAGHHATVVDGGAAAIAALERESPPFVVVADDLSDVSGLDVCRRARAGAPTGDRFVLFVTSCEDAGRLSDVLDAGADDFILTAASFGGLRARLAARAVVAERRIAAGEARRRAEAALARTQRLLGIGEASSVLQHEINNPLAALLAHAALLEQGLHDPGEERDLLGVIVEQAHRIAAVVKRISALRYADADDADAPVLLAPDAPPRD